MRTLNRVSAFAALFALAACGQDGEPTVAPVSTPAPASPPPTEWQAVRIAEGRARMDALGIDTLTIIEKRSVGASLRRVTAGTEVEAFTALPNVVYHVVEGEAEVVVGADTAAIEPGVTLFVRGREARAFRAVSSDLFLVALYANTRPDVDDPLLRVIPRSELLETKDSNSNVLHRVIDVESVTVGALMLPREIGGDLLVRHGIDELKYVVRGGGTIDAGPDVIPVEAGVVLFVDRSLTHRFTRLWRDLDVLYVWGR